MKDPKQVWRADGGCHDPRRDRCWGEEALADDVGHQHEQSADKPGGCQCGGSRGTDESSSDVWGSEGYEPDGSGDSNCTPGEDGRRDQKLDSRVADGDANSDRDGVAELQDAESANQDEGSR